MTLFGLGVQENEALLVGVEELVQRDVLDGSRGRARSVDVGYHGVEGYRHRRSSSGPIISAGSASVYVVYMFYARLREALHAQLDLYAVLDVSEDGGSAHAGVAARREVKLHAIRFLRKRLSSEKKNAGQQHRA